MAADPCAQRNPLNRAGLTQGGRKRAELGRSHFLPDERDLADLVLFGQRFAKHVQFYGIKNDKAGDWTAFFESDVTASLAALSKLPVESFRGFQLDLETWLKTKEDRIEIDLSSHFKLAFHLPLALFEIAAGHHARLPNGHPFGPSIVRLTARDLGVALEGLISWYKGALDVSGPGSEIFTDTALNAAAFNLDGAAPADQRLRLQTEIANAVFDRPEFSAAQVPDAIMAAMPQPDWAGLYAATAADPSPYIDIQQSSPHRIYEQIYDALSYNLLASAVEQVYHGLERIRTDATAHLADSLENFGAHAPQYGLWLAFLQLFDHAKGELNQFTGRHLDFYFKEILRLENRVAVPDKAHLLFELAKGHDAHLLTAGTLFRAGKDALGKTVSYALNNDIVVNRGRIEAMQGVQLIAGKTAGKNTLLPKAAPVVRSRDGLGEVDLTDTDPAFAPFGPEVSPAARIGFAIADRKLFMREGTREIVIRGELTLPISDTGVAPRWRVRLTGDEGWFELTGTTQINTVLKNNFKVTVAETKYPGEQTPPPTKWETDVPRFGKSRKAVTAQQGAGKSAKNTFIGKGYSSGKARGRRHEREQSTAFVTQRILQITVTLGPDDPPIIPLDPDLHGTDHDAGIPTVEVMFDFDQSTTSRAFSVLHDLRFDRVSLLTKASGLKNLLVVADGAVVDVAKPFAPFGARPRKKAPLHIGSSEIFSKSIADWDLLIDWEEPYSETDYFRKTVASGYNPTEWVLTSGKWMQAEPLAGKADLQLGETNATVALKSGSLIDARTEQTIENQPLTAKTRNGFLRMRLPLDFGHADYVAENTRALVALAKSQEHAMPGGINGSSSTSAVGNLPKEPYNPVINRIEASYTTTLDSVQAFSHLHPFGQLGGDGTHRLFPDLPFDGALYIGVADFDAPARLTLLVQVHNGSGDPLIPAPDLSFAYLDGDIWTDLLPQDLDDKTENFTGSGVLGLNLPELANAAHQVMPPGLYWIRVSAARDAEALNRLLSVDAQAAPAVFVDAGNDPKFLASPLPDGTISKLVVPDAAIKKIIQPYESFGGRPVEPNSGFETRVSERLRHKDRAITMWDYEALVLDAFPSLYRVKCLNTTRLMRDSNSVIVADNELAPKAVTLITVPWTHGQNRRDPLRPYTDQATLKSVDAFLRKRISPFVQLEVQNPKFEEVLLDFKVRFRPEIGDIAFYADELNKALVAYLTPWSRRDGGEIGFGGKLWKSSVIDFVDEWPHVDFVTDFRMFHKVNILAGPGGWTPIDSEFIEVTTARSILVSAARHQIMEVSDNG